MKRIDLYKKQQMLLFLRTKNNKKARRKKRKNEGKTASLVVTLTVPPNMNLDADFEETASFFIAIKNLFFKEKMHLFFNFANLKEISPAAGLLLVSEIYRLKQKSHSDRHRPSWVNGNFPEDEIVWFLLDELGFYNLLNIPRKQHQYEIPDVKFIKYVSGNILIGERLAEFLEKISLFRFIESVDFATSKKPYESLAESIANVLHHAYPQSQARKYPVLPNQWWMSGHINEKEKSVSLMFYDQGVGIPYTLPTTYFKYFSIPLILEPTDSKYIQKAVQLGETRTKAQGRGNGLADMVSFIKSLNIRPEVQAMLRITSNKGQYLCTKDGEKAMDFQHSIFGTLIEINVKRIDIHAEA